MKTSYLKKSDLLGVFICTNFKLLDSNQSLSHYIPKCLKCNCLISCWLELLIFLVTDLTESKSKGTHFRCGSQLCIILALQNEYNMARVPDLQSTNVIGRLQYVSFWCTEIKLYIPPKMKIYIIIGSMQNIQKDEEAKYW